MKKKRQNQKLKKKGSDAKEYQALFTLGAIFVGVGVTFMTTINKALGTAFIAIGGLYMIISNSRSRKK